MRAPIGWLKEFVDIDPDLSIKQLAVRLTQAGLQVEHIDDPAAAITGPVVVGQVIDLVEEPQKNGKIIRWCQVDVGPYNPDGQDHRGIVCGAHNFRPGDLVVVALPGAVLPGDFAIAARKTYGHVSDGMICAEDELGLGDDHAGIIILAPGSATPGDLALPVLGADQPVLEIDVTPDEGYCLSIRGLAREIGQLTGADYRDPAARPAVPMIDGGYPVVLDSPNCSLFVARQVTDLDPGAVTPAWMKQRLAQVGIRSISLAVDVTNYVMIELGQPLHAYDVDQLHGAIQVRSAQAGESLVTLDHQTRQLDADDLLICDDSGPIGLAGVMGGLTTEVGPQSRNLLIEAAYFLPAAIGRTYRRHNLASEASRRFERGVDPDVAQAAANRAVELLRDLAGAHIVPAGTVAGGVMPRSAHRLADPELFGSILGMTLEPEQAREILEESGVQVTDHPSGGWSLTAPTWRPDLADDYDFVEEVGRKMGFDKVEARLPRAPIGRGYTPDQRARAAVVTAVSQAGFVELITLPFIGDAQLDRLDLPSDDPRRRTVRLANPLSDAAPYLRTSLLPGLFDAVLRNTSRSLTDLSLFECGLVFHAVDSQAQLMPTVSKRPSPAEIQQLLTALPDQPRCLSGVVSGQWRPYGVFGPAESASWAQAIWAVEVMASALGLTLSRRAARMAPWHPGRCAEVGVVVDQQFQRVGFAGQIHPRVTKAWGLPDALSGFEINLDALVHARPLTGTIRALSTHPATKQDIALLVDRSLSSAAVEQALIRGGGPRLESVQLFDVYTGPAVDQQHKSLAYALLMRDPQRTLTEAEATVIRDQAVAEAAASCGARLRD
ncbi:MAG: phenylalanine--tRNA ligase subunit beta [Propionibacteriaceae bacterium]|nr:phenylalanine--tRNA ligase subunit beta [Propionibacteriaceae bacterium]